MKIIGHSPTINQSGVFRNETIKVYFDRPINPNSINWSIMSINDKNNFSSTVGNINPIWEAGVNLSGTTSGIAFCPTLNLAPNTSYSVYIYGSPCSVLGADGSELDETYSFDFTTGIEYYDESNNTVVPTNTDILTTEENTIIPFGVVKTIPQHQTPNVDTQTTCFYVTFTGNITTPVSGLYDYIKVEETSVL